jgi:hypothetical protein
MSMSVLGPKLVLPAPTRVILVVRMNPPSKG